MRPVIGALVKDFVQRSLPGHSCECVFRVLVASVIPFFIYLKCVCYEEVHESIIDGMVPRFIGATFVFLRYFVQDPATNLHSEAA